MSISAIVLLGAPGAGKGTIAEKIKMKTPYIHLSTGDILRDAVKKKTAVGRQAESYMKQGNLVPDDLVVAVVMDRMDHGPGNGQYMLDGFPRTLAQARLMKTHFDERHARLAFVFFLEVTRAVILDRLSGRRICRKCGANFHVRNIPPRKDGICDHCEGELYQRADDMEETVLNRLDGFHKQAAGLISYYEKQGILVRIDSSRHWKDIVADIMKVLEASPARFGASEA